VIADLLFFVILNPVYSILFFLFGYVYRNVNQNINDEKYL